MKMSEHIGNPVKFIFNPVTGITENLISSNPNIPVPDTKHDPLHGHIDVNQQGQITFIRQPGDSH
jgi:hypothetical protein